MPIEQFEPLTVAGLSNAVDSYIKKRDERLKLQKQVDKLQIEENNLKSTIIANILHSKTKAAAGTLAILNLNPKIIPVPRDWPKIYAHVLADEAFDLLQKRLSEQAVKDRWAAGESLPGIERFNHNDLTIAKPKC